MDKIAIKNKLVELLNGYDSRIDSSKVNDDSSFNDLGFDSLDVLDFAMVIEDEFDISLANVHSIINFGDLVESIQKELK